MSKFLYTILLLVILAGAAYIYWDSQQVLTLKISATDVIPPRFLFSVIQDRGLDEKNGLDLVLLWSPPGEVERRLAEQFEGVEVGFYNMLAMLDTNLKQGLDLRIIHPGINVPQVLMVKASSPYNSISDLKDARLSIRPKGTAAFTVQAVVMKVSGFDIENDFKLTFGTPQQGGEFLKNGEIDAVMQSPAEAAALLATGEYRLITELEDNWIKIVGGPIPFVDFAAHKEWIEQNPSKLERYRNMIREAVTLIKEKPEIVGEYKELLGITSDAQLNAITPALAGSFSTSWGLEPHRFLLQKAVELGFLEVIPSEEDVFVP